MTFDVITSDNIEFLDVREYSSMMLEALDKGAPIGEVRKTSYGKDLTRLKELVKQLLLFFYLVIIVC